MCEADDDGRWSVSVVLIVSTVIFHRPLHPRMFECDKVSLRYLSTKERQLLNLFCSPDVFVFQSFCVCMLQASSRSTQSIKLLHSGTLYTLDTNKPRRHGRQAARTVGEGATHPINPGVSVFMCYSVICRPSSSRPASAAASTSTRTIALWTTPQRICPVREYMEMLDYNSPYSLNSCVVLRTHL